MWAAHIAARRVEIGLPPMICATWARDRLRTAAQRLAQMGGDVLRRSLASLGSNRRNCQSPRDPQGGRSRFGGGTSP
jgi:hypothetical protein